MKKSKLKSKLSQKVLSKEQLKKIKGGDWCWEHYGEYLKEPEWWELCQHLH